MPKQYVPFAVAAVVGVAGFLLGDWSVMAWLLAAAIACVGVTLDTTRWGILATSMLGLACSGYLFSLKLASEAGPSICDVNEVFNCGAVNSSPQSVLFGIPIALLGTGYFLGTALASVAARDTTAQLFPTTAILSSVGVLYSLYLAGVAWSIGAVCVMCITIYICTALLVWAGIRGMLEEGVGFADAAPQIPTSMSFVTIAGTFVVVVLVGMTTWSDAEGSLDLPEINGEAPPAEPAEPAKASTDALDQDLREKLAQLFKAADGDVTLAGNEPVLGNPDAPYVIVEFADFGCPHCAQAATQLKQLVQQVPDIQVRFRPFPLSGACNPVLDGTERVDRCRAAVAAECANVQGRFWDYSLAVFGDYNDLSDEALTRAAEQAHLDQRAWLACMQERETVERVMASAVAGAKAGVMGTPTLYVQGLDGDRWFDVCAGPEAILALVQMHQRGVELPEPADGACR